MRALTQDVMAPRRPGVMIAPPNTLRTDDSIVQYYKQASEAIGADVPFVIQDYPLTFSVQMTPGVIRPHPHRQSVLLVPQARGLAGPGEDLAAARVGEGRLAAAPADPHRQQRALPRLRDGARRRRRQHRLLLPDMLVDVVRLSKAGKRDEAHDLFDAHLPLIRYEQQPGPGLGGAQVRDDAPGHHRLGYTEKPGAALTPAARAEVDYLLSRLAQKDSRARV
jgi:4-hydroxy-tetrahydrodipicolinate synthase